MKTLSVERSLLSREKSTKFYFFLDTYSVLLAKRLFKYHTLVTSAIESAQNLGLHLTRARILFLFCCHCTKLANSMIAYRRK